MRKFFKTATILVTPAIALVIGGAASAQLLDCGLVLEMMSGRKIVEKKPFRIPKLDHKRGWHLIRLKAKEAWEITSGISNVIVAVVDSGVDSTHPDLKSRIWINPKTKKPGLNLLDPEKTPLDDLGHGTTMAGIIAGDGSAGGPPGIAPGVTIMPIKYVGSEARVDGVHGEEQGDANTAIQGIQFAIDNGAKIINCSLGGYTAASDTANINAWERILKEGAAKDVLFVVAAGNDGLDLDKLSVNGQKILEIPASLRADNMIVVSASNASDSPDFRVNWGKSNVDLAAPGVALTAPAVGGGYTFIQYGSSEAAPMVTGTAALIKSLHPDWNYKQIKEAILQSVDRLPMLSDRTISGGRLNVLSALKYSPAQ